METAYFKYYKGNSSRNSDVTGGQQTDPPERGQQIHTKGGSHISGEITDGVADGIGKINSLHGAKSLGHI